MIGCSLKEVENLPEALNDRLQEDFSFIVIPLFNTTYDQNEFRVVPATRSDTVLSSYEWKHYIAGRISDWIDFDSPSYSVQQNSLKALRQEFDWAQHISITTMTLPTPLWNCSNYASAIVSIIDEVYLNLWVDVPLISDIDMNKLRDADDVDAIQYETIDNSWECWNKFRTLCGHNKKISVNLILTETVPDDHVIDTWACEPVAALTIPTDIFTTNDLGFPVLTKGHQKVVSRFFQFNVQIIIKGEPQHEKGYTVYRQYISWLHENTPVQVQFESVGGSYQDFLQNPLQPLMDNLSSQTYEVFEKDPIKYQSYGDAIALALTEGEFVKNKDEIILMVLGAGRGPLVRQAMRASKETGKSLKIYAVEKNPNAVITLLNMAKLDPEWENVTVINSDIRKWEPTELADIVVSELLGSFGDNELSPECLYDAQHLLKQGGISIPSDYTSYLAPLSSPILFNKANKGTKKSLEAGYVVQFHRVDILDEPQECFKFLHPEYDQQKLTLTKNLTFNIAKNTIIHGFAGYFDSVLYGDINISINPPTHTPGMFSWFPLYIPLTEPLYVKKDTEVTVTIRRINDGAKVWYEWGVTEPILTAIHNPGGRSWWIGL
eukprot:TRINITY_DN6357_c0_g1_i1.p1 TRINITY_DN6357_c0_g1~~TRINITY_DN6357_c0_g1_i1.p1  ORF type:complete len:605 (+),score=125.59 TRINITY_DN6357_c0_g1_i1:11-1825(+)